MVGREVGTPHPLRYLPPSCSGREPTGDDNCSLAEMALNVRKRQTDVILRILNLNAASASSSKDPSNLYKILILDRFTKDVIAPLLRVSDLRKHGITLHLVIEADRQPIPDVPAVYLVQPSQQNIERIAQDACSGLYDVMHLNFTTTLPTRFMEQLATAAVKGGGVNRIGKLFDQYLSFIALESNLFSLGLPDAYAQLNDPTAADTQIEAAVAAVVDGLFSVFVSLGVVPIIRCPSGGSAEHVAGLLDAKLRDALRARNNLLTEGSHGLTAALSRPLLCLFDRNFDLSAALQQPWTYKPLVQDVLGMKLNRVTVAAAEPGPGPSSAGAAAAKRSYDVGEADFFWEGCGTFTFAKVAEEVESQLKTYRAAVEEINKKTTAGPQDGVPYDPDDLFQRNTQNLIMAVSSLPQLQERKKTLDKHTNLATVLLGCIKTRALDQYHSIAEELLMGKSDRAAVVKLLQGPKGSATDKLRLALVWLLTYDGLPSDSEMSDLESALTSSGADVAPLQYVRMLKRNNLTGAKPSGGTVSADNSSSALSALTSQAHLLDWADKTFGQGLSHVTKTVKTLGFNLGSRLVPMVSALEALMEGRPGSEHEHFSVFDPKLPAGRCSLEHAKGPFKEAVVFVIGGGNYLEREVLTSWASKSHPTKQVVYGATEILSGEDFLQQLGEVGRRSLRA